ncbi:MAG TPA: CBS domain-containing protein [Verrucomicrobiae bacterium]|nr:CBS domain-containing protein [Verrucomicrobiae bacterium]
MAGYGLLDRPARTPTVREVLRFKSGETPASPRLVTVGAHQKVGQAISLMQRHSICQLPVVRHPEAEALTEIVESLHERGLFERLVRDPDALHEDEAVAMEPPLAVVTPDSSLDQVFQELSRGAAVLVADGGDATGLLTRADLLEYLAGGRGAGG